MSATKTFRFNIDMSSFKGANELRKHLSGTKGLTKFIGFALKKKSKDKGVVDRLVNGTEVYYEMTLLLDNQDNSAVETFIGSL